MIGIIRCVSFIIVGWARTNSRAPANMAFRLFALAEHVWRTDIHTGWRAEAHCHAPLEDVRSLMGCVQREVAVGADLGHRASGLHRLVGVPVLAGTSPLITRSAPARRRASTSPKRL